MLFPSRDRSLASASARAAALTMALVSAISCGGGQAASNEPLPQLTSTGGPETVLLRFPRSGGVPRSYRWPAIDSAIWTGRERLPALDRLLAFDDGGGLVAVVTADGRAGRLDLRTGHVQLTAQPLLRAASADGWSLYGVNNEGRLLRNTPTAEWKGPPAQVDTLFALPGGNVILVSSDAERTRFVRYRPPAVEPIDTLELPHVSALTRTVNGDRLYAETARGVLAIDTRTWKIVAGPRTGKHAAAMAPTPSGDRTLVLNEDGKTIRVWDRYSVSFTGTIKLPVVTSDLRMDPLGRFVLARMAGHDSAIVISIPVSRVVRTIATEWRSDLPTVAPDGSVLTLRRPDVIAVDAETGVQRRRVSGGALDIWMLVRWDGFVPRDALLDAPVTFASETPADSAAAAEAVDSVLAVRVAALARERLDSIARASTAARTHTDSLTSIFTLSFAALVNEADAKALARTIRVYGRQPRVVPTMRDGVQVWRVVLGPYRTRELAESAGKRSGKPYWVFPGLP